ncbi:hypothetical protein DUNSADRAFT_1702 [Dunaliella salina]|uniref:Uncharacterized protein n=1 Tax=Dunaliella salina TaxID=3046 RepID=A0ABQ7FXB6_DUNSA|nr:hypothetical protein DUNSADRAFT_1702 [Dunaliella salina]|eukprot:KAF5826947.1 hypothetical protein DUNSADRAFT_1702 [Dunaliella salina]
MALTEGVPPIQEISSWAPVLLAYTAGALSLRPGSRHSEVILAAISAARSCFAFMLGTGILPFSGTNKLLLGWRAEVPAEIIMMSVMERVRLIWMVQLRALFAVSLWLVYMRLGLAFPATQSVLVNLCSLGVTAAVEQRCRRLYASLRLSAKHQALADGGASHAPTWPTSDRASKGEHALKAQHF